MLHLLPNDINRIIFEFEGGGWFRTHFSYMVLPQMVRSCWEIWKKRLKNQQLDYMKERKERIDSYTKNIPLTEFYDYMLSVRDYKNTLLLLGYLESKYWNRMMLNPIDSLVIVINCNDYDEDDLSEFRGEWLNIRYESFFVIHWEGTKHFPDEVIVSGNIVDEEMFYNEYENIRTNYYYWNNVYGQGFIYKTIYQKNGLLMLQEMEE